MAAPRFKFHVATIHSGGKEKMFALAGHDGSHRINSVEEWVEENSTWKAADNLDVKSGEFGVVAVLSPIICPVLNVN